MSGEVSVATLHLMVGLPCSGKTTLAQKLKHEQSALRLTTDEWHIHLFGQDGEEPEHNARHTVIKMMLWKVASRASAPNDFQVNENYSSDCRDSSCASSSAMRSSKLTTDGSSSG